MKLSIGKQKGPKAFSSQRGVLAGPRVLSVPHWFKNLGPQARVETLLAAWKLIKQGRASTHFRGWWIYFLVEDIE